MPEFRFVQVDVFTDRPFTGNPLAVFPEAAGLSDERMMQIAREMNLSETVFVLNSDEPRALKRLRIFTPAREIPFAGHPIAGTWNVLAREGVVPLPDGGSGWQRIHHEVGIGVLPVDIEFRDGKPVQVVMTQGEFKILNKIYSTREQEELVGALGLSFDDLDDSLPIQVITTGLPCLAVPLRTLDSLKKCRVNSSQLGDFYMSRGGTGCHAFTRETIESGESRAHARFFAPADNIAEDPATGSACGALGAYLVYHGASGTEEVEGRHKFVIEQGDFMHRPSRINLEINGTADNVVEVRVGGPAILVAEGRVMFDE